MEELVGTLRQAQCAVLQAQRELIALRCIQKKKPPNNNNNNNNNEGTETIQITESELKLQQLSQTKQEEAVRYLERSTHLFCNLLRKSGEGSNLQEKDMELAKRAMRRYFESQIDSQKQREAQFEQQLADRDSQQMLLEESIVKFAQKASLRRLGLRVLHFWTQRTIKVCADHERIERGRQLHKTRTAVASSYAAAKTGQELRIRCFYRWRIKKLQAVEKEQQNRQFKLTLELERCREEVRRAEVELQQLLIREKARESRENEINTRVEKELQDEVIRLKTAMDEMVYEFSSRTSTYVRQQEELVRHYNERERQLTCEVVNAEETSLKYEERVTQLTTFITIQKKFFNSWINRTFTSICDCISSKTTTLHSSMNFFNKEKILMIQAAAKEEQQFIIFPLKEEVMKLHNNINEANRKIDASNVALLKQELLVQNRSEAAVISLQRSFNIQSIWKFWTIWKQYVIHRRYTRMLYSSVQQAKQEKEEEVLACWREQMSRDAIEKDSMLISAVEAAENRMMKVLKEQRELQGQTAVEMILLDEALCRHRLSELETALRQSLSSHAGRELVELYNIQIYADLAAEKRRCDQLQDDILRQTFKTEKWQKEAENLKLKRLRDVELAKIETLLAIEYANRLSLRYDELRLRHTLIRRFEVSHAAITENLNQRMIQTNKIETSSQLKVLGRLVVEYCARDAFSRWILFTERKKYKCTIRKNETYTKILTNSTTSSMIWFNTIIERSSLIYDMKLDIFFYYICRPIGSYTRTIIHLSDEVEVLKNEINATITERDTYVYLELRRFTNLFTAFTTNVTNLCTNRELLLWNSCKNTITNTGINNSIVSISPVNISSSGYRDTLACLQDPFQESDSSEAASALEQALHLLYSRRAELAQHVREAIDILRCSAAEALEAQRKQHEATLDELLQYQAFLEGKIVAADALSDELQIEQQELRKQKEKNPQQETVEMRGRIEFLLETIERNNLHYEEEKHRLEEEISLLKQQYKEEQQSHQQAETFKVFENLLEQYERVLQAFELEIADRRATFITGASMLEDVDHFSKALLKRSENNLQSLSEKLMQAQKIALQRPINIDELREMKEEHESEVAALMRTLRATQEHSEVTCRELRQQLQLEQQESRVLCETRVRRETVEMRGRIESLLETIERNNLHYEEEKHRLEEEISLLKQRIDEQANHAQNVALSMRANYEREINVLQKESQRLAAELDGLRAIAAQAAIDASQRQRELCELEAQRQQEELKSEVRRLESESQAIERRHALECDGLRHALEEERISRTEVVSRNVEDKHQNNNQSLMNMDFELFWKSILEFTKESSSIVCELMDDKLELLFAFQAECSSRDLYSIATQTSFLLQEQDECHIHLQEEIPKQKEEEEEEKINIGKEEKGIQAEISPLVLRPPREDPSTGFLKSQLLRQDQDNSYSLHHHYDKDQQKDFQVRVSPDVILQSRETLVRTPLRRSVSTEDVTQSMLRYSKMLNQQRSKNDIRLRNLDELVSEVDNLMERGRAVVRLEISSSECLNTPRTTR